jgi:hypothetical protein
MATDPRAKLDAATLKSLQEGYAKQGAGGMAKVQAYDGFGEEFYSPTSIGNFQLNAKDIGNPKHTQQGADNTDPEPATIKGKDLESYSQQVGNNVYIYDLNGNLTNIIPTGGRWGDTIKGIKFLAPAILGMGFPGLGAALGSTLGVGSTVGSALLQAGLAGATGGDPLKAGLFSALGSNSGMQIGDTGFSVGDALKGVKAVQAISGKNPLALASAAAGYMSPSGSDSTFGPSGKDIEPNSFPPSDQYPEPFTVSPSGEPPTGGLTTASSSLSDILPAARKIIGGVNTVKGLSNAIKGGPLGLASAVMQAAQSSAPQASRDKLPPSRADVRTLFPVGDNPPPYVPPSKLTPLGDFESLSKLLTG